MSVSEMLSALKGRRSTAETLASRLAKLENERAILLGSPPTREVLLNWGLRAVERAEADFGKYLTEWYFNEEYVGRVPSEWFEGDPGPRWLERQERVPGMLYDNAEGALMVDADFDRKALMAILAPQLRELIPKWIDKHWPLQKDALLADKRKARLMEIDREIADVTEQREKLAAELRGLRDGINEIVE